MNKQNKGFTLIELLVVIGIVAILSVVVILTLNPAELLKQARDSNRINDMATIRSALALYLSDQSSPNLASSTSAYTKCYSTLAATCNTNTLFGTLATSSIATTTNKVDSTGWIPVSFNAISSGAPMGSLPVDPVNSGNFFYAYAATSSNLTFKAAANGMESQKYGVTAATQVVSGDGGTDATAYEVGTNLQL